MLNLKEEKMLMQYFIKRVYKWNVVKAKLYRQKKKKDGGLAC